MLLMKLLLLVTWLANGVAGFSRPGLLSPHIVENLRGRQITRQSKFLQSQSKSNDTSVKLYKAHNFSVPIDHFPNEEKYEPHNDEKFPMRYWYDATYYKPGGPVIALCSGETSGEDRLPYLQKGIVQKLTKATNGLGVILEHRYYGTSFPTPDLSTENLRFLTTQQALADTAYFAENIVFEGLEDYDLTSDDTAWIVYGGSYAGAFVAFLRVLYPDVFWGAISSSGVTKAVVNYWEYWEPIRLFGPQDCVHTTQDFVQTIDAILIEKNNSALTTGLKTAFGMQNISYNNDFVAALTNSGIGAWQGRNWDPAVGDKGFEQYCANITNSSTIYPSTEALRSTVHNLTDISGFPGNSFSFTTRMLNFIGWANVTLLAPCAKGNMTQDQCFSSHNDTYYAQTGIEQQTWRSWAYQYCTQWGYYQTGSGTPSSIRPLVSRILDVEYLSLVCRKAFNITEPPDVDEINQYGGFDIRAPRLAFVDGQADPWRYVTPHAPQAPKRRSTWLEPFIEIEGAVHHWDENGLFPNETTASLPPAPVRDAQNSEVEFVKKWVEEYWVKCRWNDEC